MTSCLKFAPEQRPDWEILIKDPYITDVQNVQLEIFELQESLVIDTRTNNESEISPTVIMADHGSEQDLEKIKQEKLEIERILVKFDDALLEEAEKEIRSDEMKQAETNPIQEVE